MRLFFCCLFSLMGMWQILCQEPSPDDRVYKNAIELRHDNDFLLFTDRYYTTGNFIGWHTVLPSGNDPTERKQYNLFIVQQLYTPADILETDLSQFDRPYAGFLGLSNGLTITNHRRLMDFKLLLGVTGPYSGGAGIQEAT